MQVAFYKVDDGRLCAWVATPRKRKCFQGTTMAVGRDLPHDLAHFVVEETFGLQRGFWGLVAKGATFKSVPGRRRTQPGRQVIRAHRAALNAAEHVVNTHVSAWRVGASTPAGPALDTMLARWRALTVGEELRLNWAVTRRCTDSQMSAPRIVEFSQGTLTLPEGGTHVPRQGVDPGSVECGEGPSRLLKTALAFRPRAPAVRRRGTR